MAAASISSPFFQLVLVLLVIQAASMATAVTHQTMDVIKSTCKATPHPELCMNTLTNSSAVISIPTNPTLNFAAHTLDSAISKARKLSSFLADTGTGGTKELHDCKELHDISMSCLRRSASMCGINTGSLGKKELADINIYLSAALTNKITCLQGLSTVTGAKKDSLVNYLTDVYKYVSNSLAIVSKSKSSKSKLPSTVIHNRRLMGEMIPTWLPLRDRKVLQIGGINIGSGGNNEGYKGNDDNNGGTDIEAMLTLKVSADGSETYRTISDAVLDVPENSNSRTIIQIKAGVYEENVVIPSNKMNVAFVGEGADVTIIRGNRNVADGWKTFYSATVGT